MRESPHLPCQRNISVLYAAATLSFTQTWCPLQFAGSNCGGQVGRLGFRHGFPHPQGWRRRIPSDDGLQVVPVGKGRKPPAVGRTRIVINVPEAPRIPGWILPVSTIASAALAGCHNNEALIVSRSSCEHSIDVLLVELMRLVVRRDRALERPKSNERVGRGSEENS